MYLTKLELRTLLKTKRLALSLVERTSKSDLIVGRLNDALDWSDVNTVHIYEPLLELGEVDVSKFSRGKKIYTSRKIGGVWQVVALSGDESVPEQFDVIIVPMLGFDESLHRIGYGGGFYDKFLASQPQAKKIGVCFETGHVDKLPFETHDVCLNLIITESRIYK